MSWTVKYIAELDFVELIYVGVTTGADLAAASAQSIAMNKEKGTTKGLVDVSKIELEASLFDVLNIPSQMFENEKLDRRLSIALIMPTSEKGKEAAQFYQMACANRGWNVKLFTDRKSAIDWLMKQPNVAKIEK